MLPWCYARQDSGHRHGRRAPCATFYVLNRDHAAADAIVALTRLRTTIIDRITDAVSTGRPNLSTPASSAPWHAERPQRHPGGLIQGVALDVSSRKSPWGGLSERRRSHAQRDPIAGLVQWHVAAPDGLLCAVRRPALSFVEVAGALV